MDSFGWIQRVWLIYLGRGPKARSGTGAWKRRFLDLDVGEARSIDRMHFFTPANWLERCSPLNNILCSDRFRPTFLTITIRYCDWFLWEFDINHYIRDCWLRHFNGSPGLRQLKIEYETIPRKKQFMMRTILQNKEWKLPVRREGSHDLEDYEGYLSADATELSEWSWEGPSKLDGRTYDHHGPGETMVYVVVTDTWNFVEGLMSKKDASRKSGHRCRLDRS